MNKIILFASIIVVLVVALIGFLLLQDEDAASASSFASPISSVGNSSGSMEAAASDSDDPGETIRFDFSASSLTEDGTPSGWTYKGRGELIRYELKQDPETGRQTLRILSGPKSSGAIMIDMSRVDLKKTPIMRWRWKASVLPQGKNADARAAKSDQGIAVYVGYGKIKQSSVSFTWETETPKGLTGDSTYNFVVKVHWRVMRNKEDALGVWLTEEVDLREVCERTFGKIPEQLALSISSNSQYTGTSADAEIDYVEFSERSILPVEEKGE